MLVVEERGSANRGGIFSGNKSGTIMFSIFPNNLRIVIQEETRWTLAESFIPGWNVFML
jgi:hypothetical protein